MASVRDALQVACWPSVRYPVPSRLRVRGRSRA